MSLLLLAAALATAAQEQPLPRPPETVVVTAPSLDATRRALQECLQRRCSPAEDMEASQRHAYSAFVAGEYAEARAVLKRSFGRNRHHAKALPVEVSSLARGIGRVAAHLGEKEDYNRFTWYIGRALRQGLPADDPRLIMSGLEIGDMLIETDRIKVAKREYERAGRRASEAGNKDLAAVAQVRLAWLDHVRGLKGDAKRKLRLIATQPGSRRGRVAAFVALARLNGNGATEIDTVALAREIRALGPGQPVLLWQPSLDHVASGLGGVANTWIDVGFWIEGDGSVREAEILRHGTKPNWAARLMRAISSRRYAPPAAPDYRIERFTLTSFWVIETGSRVRKRSSTPRIETFDLTGGRDPPPHPGT